MKLRRARPLLIVLGLLALLGCMCGGPGSSGPLGLGGSTVLPAGPAPVAPVAPSTPAAPAPAVPVTPADAPEPPPVDPAQALLAAYELDCAFVNRVPVDDGSEHPATEDECAAEEFDQNCSPDLSGCWSALQTCKSDCAKPCGDCQASCAASCSSCKAACAPGDHGCLSACASDRLNCRGTCMLQRTSCVDERCPDEDAKCEAGFEARRDKECGPNCDPHRGCYPEDGKPDCDTRFPVPEGFCRDACAMGD